MMKILAGVEEVASEEDKELINGHICNNHHEKKTKSLLAEESTKPVINQVGFKEYFYIIHMFVGLSIMLQLLRINYCKIYYNIIKKSLN